MSRLAAPVGQQPLAGKLLGVHSAEDLFEVLRIYCIWFEGLILKLLDLLVLLL